MKEDIISEYLTPRDIADRLKVDVSTVRRWIKKGVVPSIALPNVFKSSRIQYRIHRDTFEKLTTPVTAN